MQKTFILDKKNVSNFFLDIKAPCLVFLKGDLGSGKTTLSAVILKQFVSGQHIFPSPTYVYYNVYEKNYHFDLFRINSYEAFFLIGGEEILDNNKGIILIEWPEVIEKYYKPDVEILIRKIGKDLREITVNYRN